MDDDKGIDQDRHDRLASDPLDWQPHIRNKPRPRGTGEAVQETPKIDSRS